MEYMYLVWYVIVCGRNGEGYDSSSCTWIICILAGTLLCVGGMVRAMIAAPAHGVYVSWPVRYSRILGIMITRNGTDVVICETDIP
jgi:hypothetical protein